MREWVVIALAGAFGGIVAVLVGDGIGVLRKHLRVEEGETGQDRTRHKQTPGEPGHVVLLAVQTTFFRVLILVLNAVAAAVGSYLLWATYTGEANFQSSSFSPAEVAASIIVGLSGTGALQGYLHERSEVANLRATVEDMVATLKSSQALDEPN